MRRRGSPRLLGRPTSGQVHQAKDHNARDDSDNSQLPSEQLKRLRQLPPGLSLTAFAGGFALVPRLLALAFVSCLLKTEIPLSFDCLKLSRFQFLPAVEFLLLQLVAELAVSSGPLQLKPFQVRSLGVGGTQLVHASLYNGGFRVNWKFGDVEFKGLDVVPIQERVFAFLVFE